MQTMQAVRSCGLSVLLAGSVGMGPVQAQVTIPAQPALTAPLMLRGITVIDVRNGRRLRNQQVEIVGNRILTIEPATRARVPQGAKVVDAQGKFLIPGLWDMHSHAIRFLELADLLNLANGVTGIRDLGSPIPLDTLGVWKRDIVAGRRVGPRLIVSGPHLASFPRGEGNRDILHVVDSTPEGIRRLVDSLHTAGADLIKTYISGRPDLYFTAAAEARRLSMRFGGHGLVDSVAGVDGLTLSDSGATLLDHFSWLLGDPCGTGSRESLNVARCAEAGRHFRRNGTWIVLTPFIPAHPASKLDRLRYAPAGDLGPSVGISGDSFSVIRRQGWPQEPGFRDGPPTSTADWRAFRRKTHGFWADYRWIDNWAELLRFFPIVLGTDYGPHVIAYLGYSPGFGVHEGLVGEVMAGMSPLEALRTATLNPALALGLSDSLGTVEAGKVADLVLLDADPLTDIWSTTKIRAVIANGRYYDRAALDGVLAEAERVAKRP